MNYDFFILNVKPYVDSKETEVLFSCEFMGEYKVVGDWVVDVIVVCSTCFIHLVYIVRPFFDYKFYTIPEMSPYFDDEFSIFL